MTEILADFAAGLHDEAGSPPTPMEVAQFRRFSRSAEITEYLHALAAQSALAKIEVWGYSVRGQAISALKISDAAATGKQQIKAVNQQPVQPPKLCVVVVGTQHGGSEAAGGEALLVLARQLLFGCLRPLLQDMDIYLLSNANPDGRDADVSKNANDNNLNRDYVLLSQPESRALDQALARIRPHVVLDAHESAALKRKTLGLEGFMTEFEAQLDFANNPAVALSVQEFCEEEVMKPLLSQIAAGGLPAQRYIKEIGSTRQPLTHGGFTARVFRNKAGICGALSFLLETRMDPRDGKYPTFRNIKIRRNKQLYCMHRFLRHIVDIKSRILAFVCDATTLPSHGVLNADFVEHPHEPITRLPLRRIDTQEITEIEFINHRHMRLHTPMKLPAKYYVTDYVALISHLLRRHSIVFEMVRVVETVNVTALSFTRLSTGVDDEIEVDTRGTSLTLQPGWLSISLDQPRGLLLPQLLEPQSTSSFFRYERYHALCRTGTPFFIYRGYA